MYRNVATEMSRDRNDQDRKVPWPQRPDRKGQIASARPKWLRLKRPDRISQTETAKPIGRVPWGGGWSGWENGYKPLLYRFGTSLFECLAFSICSRGFLNTKMIFEVAKPMLKLWRLQTRVCTPPEVALKLPAFSIHGKRVFHLVDWRLIVFEVDKCVKCPNREKLFRKNKVFWKTKFTDQTCYRWKC